MTTDPSMPFVLRTAVCLSLLKPKPIETEPRPLVASTTINWIPESGAVDMHRTHPKSALPHKHTKKRDRDDNHTNAPPFKKKHVTEDVDMPWDTYLASRGQPKGYVGPWTKIQQRHDPAARMLTHTPRGFLVGTEEDEEGEEGDEGVHVYVEKDPHTTGDCGVAGAGKLPFVVRETITGKKLWPISRVLAGPVTDKLQLKHREDPHVVYGTRDIRSITDTTETLQEVALAIKLLHAEQRKRDHAQVKKYFKGAKGRKAAPESEESKEEDDLPEEDDKEDARDLVRRLMGKNSSRTKRKVTPSEPCEPTDTEWEVDPRKIEQKILLEAKEQGGQPISPTQKRLAQSVIIPPLEACTVDHRTATLEQLKGAWTNFMQTLYSIPMARGFNSYYPQQEKMLKSMCSTLAVAIFDTYYTDALGWLVSNFGLTHAKFVVGVVASRQVGKTTLAAALMVSALVSFGKLQMGIASTGQRASINVLLVVKEFLRSLEAHKGGIYQKDTQQRMKIVLDNGSSITALPMSVDTNRGIPYDVVYADEAAFIKVEMLSKVVVPLLVRPGRCLFMTSTPHTDPANHFTRLLTENEGDLIDVVVLSLVCDACAAMKGFDGACPHRQSLLSEDVKSSRARLTEDILKCISDEATVQTELQGRPSIKTSAAFNPIALKDFQDAKAVSPVFTCDEAKPKFMFMCVDPTGGGPSDLAIITGYGVRIKDSRQPLTIVSTFILCVFVCVGGAGQGGAGRGGYNTLMNTQQHQGLFA